MSSDQIDAAVILLVMGTAFFVALLICMAVCYLFLGKK